MNYNETVQFLFNSLPVYQRQGKAAYKANLDNTLALDQFLGNPHRDFKSIHVAGTNGKGSVSHMLASIFQSAGYTTGLYTSPHMLDFRERIKVNGKEVDEDFVVDFVERIKPQIELLKPSFFEMTVAMAFEYFKHRHVDVAIIETGMGGRLDSTNILTPLAAVITNIGLDHTQFLGNSIAEIAAEKAGIIKPGIPTIIGESTKESEAVFRAIAKERNSPIVFANDHYHLLEQKPSAKGQFITLNKGSQQLVLEIDLAGVYQANNLMTVLSTLDIVMHHFNELNKHTISEGLSNSAKNTGLRGRWETVNENPKVICDTGHNAEGVELIVKQINAERFQKLHMVLGMVNDKSSEAVLALLPKSATYYFTKASIPRAKSPELLRDEASNFQLNGECFDDVKSAYSAALNNAQKHDLIFVGGSTFVVADLLASIGLR